MFSLFIPPETLTARAMPRGGRCHTLVAAALCCACVCVAGIDLDDVMAALPETTRALLRKQNAEVTAMTDTICARLPAALHAAAHSSATHSSAPLDNVSLDDTYHLSRQ